MTRFIVIDTSYLLEYFAVTNPADDNIVCTVRDRFGSAMGQKCSLFVPVSCLFEVANHAARSPRREGIGRALEQAIQSSLRSEGPWTIVSVATEELPEVFGDWYRNYLPEKLSLTDYTVAREADRLKKRYRMMGAYLVHIWTRDQALKAREPDAEPNPYLG